MTNGSCDECGTPLETSGKQQKQYDGWAKTLKIKTEATIGVAKGGAEAGVSSPADENVTNKESGHCPNFTDCEQARNDAIKNIQEARGWSDLPREHREWMSNEVFKEDHKTTLENLRRTRHQLDDEYLNRVNEELEDTIEHLNDRVEKELESESPWKKKMRNHRNIDDIPDEIKDINEMRKQHEELSKEIQQQLQKETERMEQSASDVEEEIEDATPDSTPSSSTGTDGPSPK